jgi:nucleotidyltransferase/DNA polymerase involved in DNA repair
MQLRLGITSREELQKCWAFARSETRKKDPNDSYITACSPNARILGIKQGMSLEDAHMLLPGLKAITYTGGRS